VERLHFQRLPPRRPLGARLIEEMITMSVEKAEAVVAQFEQKRSACVRHGTELQDERATVAAHTGDQRA
jgi:hypothetical protein